MASFQGSLEDVINNLTEEKAKDLLIEIGVSLAGAVDDKEHRHDVIADIFYRLIN